MNPEHQKIINTIQGKDNLSRGEKRLLQAIKEMGDIDSAEQRQLDSLFNIYQQSQLLGTEEFLIQLLTDLGLGKLKADVEVISPKQQEPKLKVVTPPNTDEPQKPTKPVVEEPKKEEVVEPVTPIEDDKKTIIPNDTTEPVVIPTVEEEEVKTEDGIVTEPQEEDLDPATSGNTDTIDQSTLETRIRDTITIDSLDNELSGKFLDTFVKKYQNTIKSNPERYISKAGHIFGKNSFLKDIIKKTLSDFLDTEKQGLREMNFELKGFYIGKNKKKERVVVDTTYRVYLGPYVQERPKVDVDDSILKALEEGNPIPDTKTRDYIFDLFYENIFKSETEYKIHGITLDIKEQKEKILQNIETLVSFVIDMESNFGKDTEHGVSSAKGRLQYLNGESNGIVNLSTYNIKEGKFTSLHTGINKARIILKSSKIQTSKSESVQEFFTDAQEKVQESYLYSTLDFSTEQEMLLYILQLLCQAKSDGKGFRGLTKGLMNFLILGDSQEMTKLYKKYHHRNPDRATLNSINTKLPKYEERLQTLLSPEQAPVFEINSLVNTKTTLKEGEEGVGIQTLQRCLGILGYPIEGVSLGDETTTFGPATKKALVDFQINNQIIPSRNDSAAGLFGPGTKAKMKTLLGPVLQGKDGEVLFKDIVLIFEGKGEGIKISPKKVITPEKETKTLSGDIQVVREINNSLGDKYSEVLKEEEIDTIIQHYEDNKEKYVELLGEKSYKRAFGTVKNVKKVLEGHKEGEKYSTTIKRVLGGGKGLYNKIIRKYQANYSTAVYPRMVDLYKKGEMSANPQIQEISSTEGLIKSGKLVQLEQRNDKWRFEKLGILRAGKDKVDAKFLRVHPQGKKVLNDITDELQSRLQLADGKKVRIVSQSALRPVNYNKRKSSTSFSVHTIGRGFDISLSNFDIVSGKSYVNHKWKGIRPLANDILTDILVELHDKGRIVFTREGNHHHITVL